MKNKKIHQFKFGYLVCLLSLLLIALITTIVVIRINKSKDPVEYFVDSIGPSCEYSYENKKEEEGIYYIINDDQAIICGYNETLSHDIIIKDSYEGYPTVKIGYSAFSGCINLKSVVLPSTVRTISYAAFSGCTSLTSVIVAKDIKNKRRFPSSTVNWFNFEEIDNAICNNAFYNCTSLTKITIPDNTQYIMNNAFGGCSNLKSIYIPKNVKDINPTLFANCINLESIVVDSENTIYDSRDNCNGIILILSNELVVGCKTTTIPSTVTTIGEQAFYCCEGLNTFIVPDHVTTIKNQAFEYCTSLTSITISKSVTSINGSAFSGCDNLVSITVDKDNPVYDSRENCNAIIVTSKNSLRAGCKSTIIPSSVVSIEGSAFINNRTISDITIPSTITHIGKYAFSGCVSLKSITIPSSVTDLVSYAFWSCTNLKEVTFEEGTKTMNGNAFQGCTNLEKIVIPKSIEEINNESFCSLEFVTIQYDGKKSEWKSILSKDWDQNIDSYIVQCENGKITK